ncbi:uncharacterized protein MAL13P1.304-like [Cotesia glomerata]|uniref:uncharacterized protein MAL13P1.304-like n=1 Tax=Cotesia glomerata TaxID=32391 RepID=UPI001D019D07|nr:uncharacterized protein MAL13P1.304-like [Cotesia glomerata]
MNLNSTSPTINCGNILPQFLQEKVVNLKIGEKTYNQGWGNLTIGRSHFNDVIIKDKSVSAFHANLEVGSRGVFITDHNATNFTYINNVQIPARERMPVLQTSSVKFGEVFCIIEYQQAENLSATPEKIRDTSSSPEKHDDSSVILLDQNQEVNNDNADNHNESREEINLSTSEVDIENYNYNDNDKDHKTEEETRSESLTCTQASVNCRRYHDNEDDRIINIIHSLSQSLQINQSDDKDNNDKKEDDVNDDNRLNNNDDNRLNNDADHHNNNNEDDDHHNNHEDDDHHNNHEDH